MHQEVFDIMLCCLLAAGVWHTLVQRKVKLHLLLVFNSLSRWAFTD